VGRLLASGRIGGRSSQPSRVVHTYDGTWPGEGKDSIAQEAAGTSKQASKQAKPGFR
jgi:hypothetical protein